MMGMKFCWSVGLSFWMVVMVGCGGGSGIGTDSNSNFNGNANSNSNGNQNQYDAGLGEDGALPDDGGGPGPDGDVTACDPSTDVCCDADGTLCDHGCDGTNCYPECDPATHPCCDADGTLTGGGHDVCELGGPLDSACDTCAEAVCQVDPYCCGNDWDLLCFDAVGSECGVDCATGVVSCDDQYGGAVNYLGCLQGGGTCSFNTSTSASSCADLCASFGGECVDAYNNSGDCGHDEQTGCGHTGFATEICICSRGCGANDPCTPPGVCQDGQCI
jgi:hypothetical protein